MIPCLSAWIIPLTCMTPSGSFILKNINFCSLLFKLETFSKIWYYMLCYLNKIISNENMVISMNHFTASLRVDKKFCFGDSCKLIIFQINFLLITALVWMKFILKCGERFWFFFWFLFVLSYLQRILKACIKHVIAAYFKFLVFYIMF